MMDAKLTNIFKGDGIVPVSKRFGERNGSLLLFIYLEFAGIIVFLLLYTMLSRYQSG